MTWYEILVGLLGTVGGLGGLLSVYKAAPQKRALEIENLIATMDREKKYADEFREAADKKIVELLERIDKLEARDKIYYTALMASYRCRKFDDVKDCPALSTLSELCDKNDGVCPIDH